MNSKKLKMFLVLQIMKACLVSQIVRPEFEYIRIPVSLSGPQHPGVAGIRKLMQTSRQHLILF
jgi:hypothetical protein